MDIQGAFDRSCISERNADVYPLAVAQLDHRPSGRYLFCPGVEHSCCPSKQDINSLRLVRSHAALDVTRSQLEETNMATLDALVAAIDLRDPYTHDHCRRVAGIVSKVAIEMGMADQQRHNLELAALLHDIGKIGVPDAILLKTTRLTKGEVEAIRAHPEIGYQMLSGLRFLGDALPALRYHHERLDGTGYPFGLAGDRIPLLARVLAVADAYDAMTSDRPYRSGTSTPHSLAEIVRCSDTHFDPAAVSALVRVFRFLR